MKNNKYTEAIEGALKSLKDISTTEAIIGNPILTPSGSTVIPISKVTVGLVSGKGEYGEVKIFSRNKNYPNSNASGGVASVVPIGFLIEEKSKIKYLSCPKDYIDKTLETLSGLLNDKK